MKSILLTGGFGYIGSHTCLALSNAGYKVCVIDNLSNAFIAVLDRIFKISGKSVELHVGDIRDDNLLAKVLKAEDVGTVIHFAGLKSVNESVGQPLKFYENNVVGTLCLLRAMESAGIRNLVFSSSATVYGIPTSLPIAETAATSVTNAYGRSKLFVEGILEDVYRSNGNHKIINLRYFNPVGAHPSGLIGEKPQGIPNNLMPYISQVAAGILPYLNVYGNDYSTPDGTGVRDYIHVMDLAEGHLAALRFLEANEGGMCLPVNLGTGRGYSVLEMIHAFETASGVDIPFKISGRRPGDVASCYADPGLAERLFGWKAKSSLGEMCADTWRWQSMNPNGYD